ncbi:hypothetical protein [Veillonella sp.]|uniref:hypothetical protein n=1 Tax=Veillonella sp. TaxID=1926307 RepID=UPI0025F8461D|nr:hypothetical protein [Veillonella sp.]
MIEMKYYYFTLDGKFSMVLDEYISFGSQLIMVSSEIEYTNTNLRLVNGRIEEFTPEPLDFSFSEIEDSTYTDPVTQEILSAIAELSEAVYGLHGGNDNDNF